MNREIEQAVILSAGMGARLRPITDNIPKVMVPLDGKPLLEHHVEHFKRHGVREFFINLFYLPQVIRDYFGDGSKWGVKINYVLEGPEIRGTAGGTKNFEGKLKNNFFVIYGDIFSVVDYSKMREYFYQKPESIGMELIGETDHPYDSDLAEVDENLKFLKIYPKPHKELPKNYKSMRGIYILNERILNYIPALKYYEIDHQLLPDILEKGEKFYGYKTNDFLKDIGTLERYKQVEDFLSKQKGN